MLPELRLPDRRILFGAIAGLGLLHPLVLFALPHPLLASNVIQFVAPILAVVLCLHHGRATSEPFYRRAWFMMALAFGVWVAAQGDYLLTLIRHHAPGSFPGFTDFLWLSFCFPILLLASWAGEKERHDVALILDLMQAALSVGILFGIMYSNPTGITDSVAYDIQGLGLVLVMTLALSNCRAPGERIFFRGLTWFCMLNALLTAAGVLAQDHGSPVGGVTDLAWSYPVLFFCAVAVGLPDRMARADSKKVPDRAPSFHMHGISSMGLTLTSLAGAAALLQHEMKWGMLCFLLSGFIFAARALARETQFRRIYARLLHTALHDELTGLANRRLITEELANISADMHTMRALLLIDLDRFKMINDSMGHAMGDSLLIQVAERLRSSLPAEDIVARFGGDEFVVLLHGSDRGDNAEQVAEQVAEHLVAELRRPMLLGTRWISITASIGVVTFTGREDISMLLRSGDLAMYRAKSLGKNRQCLFEPELLATAIRESEIEAALRMAIDRGELYLDYQPICEVATGSVICVEALARWTHEVLGSVSPAEFIPIAETTGLISELGRIILQMACSQVAAWNGESGGSLRVSVNVSTVQLLDQSFAGMLQEILDATQCNPSMLWLEVTESVLMMDHARVQEVFVELREMGVTMCLDDFGTGFSSLSYLTTFPFDIVKLDRGFVRNIQDDATRSQMVTAIVRLASLLGKQVVVEGLETQAEFDLIAPSQCAFAQGYFFARPLSRDKISMSLVSGFGTARNSVA